MKTHNRREALIKMGSSAVASKTLINTVKWATPAILLQSLPLHAQSSNGPTNISTATVYSNCQPGFGLAALGNQLFRYTARSVVTFSNFSLPMFNDFNLTGAVNVDSTIEMQFILDGRVFHSFSENISNTLSVGETAEVSLELQDDFVIDVGTTSRNFNFDVITRINHRVADSRFGEIAPGIINDTLVLNNTITGNLDNNIFFTGSFATNVCSN